jgi:internalin A
MKLQKSIALACCVLLALSGNGLSAKAAETRSGNSRRTFADWCREKADLSPEAKHTVEVLLEIAETTECDAANQTLSSFTELLLRDNQISDIKPLESLTNLTFLDVGNNQISDIKPLESLTNLGLLHLADNQISDIKPLESLTNLNVLYLFNNQISDIKPLESLTTLNLLYLGNNQISDIKPLESLTNLTFLDVGGNQISDIKPLESLTNLIGISLNQNQISDIKPLESLTNLTELNLEKNQISDIKPLESLTKLAEIRLSGNPIAPKTCPLKPESICKWKFGNLALSGNGLSAKAAGTQPGKSGRTFADWCRQKASLSPEAKHTVEVLLQKAETTECGRSETFDSHRTRPLQP